MIDKLHIASKDGTLLRALKSLHAVLLLPESNIVRDAEIQRFEYCFELAWKTLKLALEFEGKSVSGSPRQILQNSLIAGLLNREEDWFRILAERNHTTHIYKEELSKEIYHNLPKSYERNGLRNSKKVSIVN